MRKKCLSIILLICILASSVIMNTGNFYVTVLADDIDQSYLEDLTPIESDRYTGNQGDSFIGKIGTRTGNRGADGIIYDHGLEIWIARWNFMNESSWAWAKYEIPKEMRYISGTLTYLLDSYNKNNFEAVFEIYGDDDLIFSQVINQNNTQGIDICVSLVGYSYVTIKMQDSKSVKGGTAFCFGNAIFSKDKSGDNENDNNQQKIEYFQDHKYQLIDKGMIWNDAKEYCESIGGHLATITSSEEQEFITKLLEHGNRNSYWVGGYKKADNSWAWITEEEFKYTNWASRMPDNDKISGGEDSLMIYRNLNPRSKCKIGEWNDLSNKGICGTESFFGLTNFGLICEWENSDVKDDVASENGQMEIDFRIKVKANAIRTDEISVADADVTLYNHRGQVIEMKKTERTGFVFFENLEGGHPYSVKIDAFGYKTYEKKNIEILDDGYIEIPIYLEDKKSEFSQGYDSNSFNNSGEDFLIEKVDSGWLGKAYPVSKENYNRLKEGESWSKRIKILSDINLKNSKWYGACQGISTTMILAECGEFDVSKYRAQNNAGRNECYSDLQIPNTDFELLDDINYYHLAQYKYYDKYNAFTWNPLKLVGLKVKDDRRDVSNSEFFEELITTARKGIPFLLCFGFKNYNTEKEEEKDEGHAIVCIKLDEETETEYVLKCCDPNCINEYMYFVVSKDYHDLYFSAGCNDSKTPFYKNKNGKFDWNYLEFITKEQLKENIQILSHCESQNVRLMQVEGAVEEQTGHTFFCIDGSSFCIENAEGKKLAFDGNSYSGDMEVYSISTDNHETKEKMIYEIDNSNQYTVTQFNEGTEIQVGNNDYIYSVAPSVQGKIVFTSKGIEMQAMNISGIYFFESEIATRQVGNAIIRINGCAEDNSSLTVDGNNIILNSETALSGITAEKITEYGTRTASSEQKFKNGIIGTDTEENFQINTERLVENIVLESKRNLESADIIQLNAIVYPDTASNKSLIWTSDNSSVATVDQNGLVTAVAAGKSTITVSSTDGSNVSASCVITVTESDNVSSPDDDNVTDDNTGGNTSTDDNTSGGTTGGNLSGGGSSNEGTTGGSSLGNPTGNSPSGGGSSGGASGSIPGGSSGNLTGGNPSGGTSGSIPSGSTGGNPGSNPSEDNPSNGGNGGLQVKLLYYIVEFNANSGNSLSRKTMTLLMDDTLGILPKIKRKQYDFKGWYTQKSGGEKVTQATVLNASTTLYAQWAETAKSAKPAKLSLTAKKGRQMKVSYKKVSGASGYQIAYSTNKKFASSATKKVTTSSTSKTLKNLKKGKPYYVRVRAYQTDSAGNKVYGTYSEKKSIKIKA